MGLVGHLVLRDLPDDPADGRVPKGSTAKSRLLHPHRLPHPLTMPVIHTKGQQFFPELAAFMGGYFHQDFDINGDTLEEVVAVFIADSDAGLCRLLIGDIDGFLATGEVGMEERFQDYFRPDIIPTGFRPTTQAFLLAIRGELEAALARSN